jgi:plasmid stability protein
MPNHYTYTGHSWYISMSSLTIKNIPTSLLDKIRSQAAADRHSLTQEIIFLLETALNNLASTTTADARQTADQQLTIWRQLAGQWQSDQTVADEIQAIYQKRSQGR